MNPDVLPCGRFSQGPCQSDDPLRLAMQSVLGWKFLSRALIHGFATMQLQCGTISFEAMTGSFRFWMEALRMRGSIYNGSAWCGKRYNGLDPYRFGFGAIQCLSDRSMGL